MTTNDVERTWLKVLGPNELSEGRVVPVTCAHRTVCMTRFEGSYAALDNKCPHQGGPLGEGSIEGGMLRCPWHGWDFHPLTGKPPGGYDDGVETFPVEEREDGIYVGFPVEAPHQTTVSDVMAETMANWGIRWVFGMVGHSNLGLADAHAAAVGGRAGAMRLRRHSSRRCRGFRLLWVCQADAAVRQLVSPLPGPGPTNLLTGLWDAKVDRAPVAGADGAGANPGASARGAFQDIDSASRRSQQVARFSPSRSCAKAPGTPSSCQSGRARTLLVERDVAHLILPRRSRRCCPAGACATAGKPEGRMAALTVHPPDDALERAATRLRKAKRPVVIVGHGARFQMDAVIALAEALNAPVLTTFKGKGLISDAHPLAGGVLGRSGTPVASWFMNECDLLVVFGASFSNHTGITPKKPIVQVDFEPMALGRVHAVEVPVLGEIGVTATALLTKVKQGAQATDQRAEVAERWAIWRAEKEKRRGETRGKGLSSAVIFDALTRAAPATRSSPWTSATTPTPSVATSSATSKRS